MQLSRRADYALRAVQHLSPLPKGTLGSIHSISKAESIPRDFLAKILKDLTTSGILTSYQGVHGGYALLRKPQEMSFLDVIEAVDGPIHLNLCTETGGTYCEQVRHCPIHGFWVDQEKALKRALASQKFSKYVKRRR